VSTPVTPAPTLTTSPTQSATPRSIPTPEAASIPPATSIPITPAAFFLKVTAPQDESVVTTGTVQVTGETTPNAVVTVNSQLAEVDADGRFQVSLNLTEGPNLIEVVASDFSNNQFRELRTVIFVR